ncbi:MAG: putative Ig domain-containing protein [Nitrospira sp.]|nr:putative Ig domain-containing protein [Nitrospira sp.]
MTLLADSTYRPWPLLDGLLLGLLFCLSFVAGCNDVSEAPAPDPGPGALTVVTASLPDATVRQPYSITIGGSGGITPYSWAVTPPLPANLSFNGASGAISGMPATQGTTSHTFTLQDSSKPPQTTQKTLSLKINQALVPPAITTLSLPAGTVNAPYPQTTLTATGGVPPLIWQPVGMPFGLTFDAASHSISGVPTSSGTATVTFTVNDSAIPFNQTASGTLTITVNVALKIDTSSLPDATVNQGYGPVSLNASGGGPPYTWSIVGGAPPAPGLALSSGGVITGTPTAKGAFTNTYRLQDNNGAAVTQSLTITVAELIIDTTALPTGRVGEAYGPVSLSASGGTPPYAWSATVIPALPTGLLFDPNTGTISGAPLVPELNGSHVFTVHDAAGRTTSKSLGLTILDSLTSR